MKEGRMEGRKEGRKEGGKEDGREDGNKRRKEGMLKEERKVGRKIR